VGRHLPPVRVAFPLPGPERLSRDPGVRLKRLDRGMPAVGEQGRRVGAVLGSVHERGVPKLVEVPWPARLIGGQLLEELVGAPVGQPGPAELAKVGTRERDASAAARDEEWTVRTPVEQPRKEPARLAGRPGDGY
jgi:hypothetical protein